MIKLFLNPYTSFYKNVTFGKVILLDISVYKDGWKDYCVVKNLLYSPCNF